MVIFSSFATDESFLKNCGKKHGFFSTAIFLEKKVFWSNDTFLRSEKVAASKKRFVNLEGLLVFSALWVFFRKIKFRNFQNIGFFNVSS